MKWDNYTDKNIQSKIIKYILSRYYVHNKSYTVSVSTLLLFYLLHQSEKINTTTLLVAASQSYKFFNPLYSSLFRNTYLEINTASSNTIPWSQPYEWSLVVSDHRYSYSRRPKRRNRFRYVTPKWWCSIIRNKYSLHTDHNGGFGYCVVRAGLWVNLRSWFI